MKQVYLLRHGEKDEHGNLTPQGVQNAKRVGSTLPQFAAVLSSPSSRAMETAAAISGQTPIADERALYFGSTEKVSNEIGRLAADRSITFYQAAMIYEGGLLVPGIRDKARELNALVDEQLALLRDGQSALIVSHDMSITPAMDVRGIPETPVHYLSGYIINDAGVVSEYIAS